MTSSTTEKLSLGALTSLVVGSMIGAGIFSLPSTFGRATGVLGALIAWIIAGTGMLMLAFVFQSLAQRKPDMDAGIYSYAKAGFGNYLGFASAFGFWIGSCVGNVSYWVLIKSTLGAFFPIFGDGNTLPAILVASVLLWAFHILILRGVKEAATLNTIATVAKILPIGLFLIVIIFGFKADVFALNIWGGEMPSWQSLFGQVRNTMLITVFVFIGIEGASVYSRYAKERSHVGLATIMGFVGVLCLMMMVTMLSYGIMLRPDLGALRNPSMAGVLSSIVGPWGAKFISIGLIISVLGAYLSWSLLCAEVLWASAKTNTMPKIFSTENDKKVPSAALWLTNITIQFFLIITMFSRDAFTIALELTSSLTLIPYLLVAGYALKLAWTKESYENDPANRNKELGFAAIATIYALGMMYAGGAKHMMLSALIYVPGSVLYYLARREQNAEIFTPIERIIFGIVVITAFGAVYALASGKMII
ncbi:basic amino acid/polyamine antiporter [Neisseriaceae bacterium TC5R-5]|nr:basic amino acid/polyamine antiporter [Neisseriaceae bacterium TC5R-5]